MEILKGKGPELLAKHLKSHLEPPMSDKKMSVTKNHHFQLVGSPYQ